MEGAATTALPSAEPVESCQLPTWECETGWSNDWIMCNNLFIRSCGSFPAGPPQVGLALMGSDKELGTVPWWFLGLEAAMRMFNEKALGWSEGNFKSEGKTEAMVKIWKRASPVTQMTKLFLLFFSSVLPVLTYLTSAIEDGRRLLFSPLSVC